MGKFFKHFSPLFIGIILIGGAIGLSFHSNYIKKEECISFALSILFISNILVIWDTGAFMFNGENLSSEATITTNKEKFKKYRKISLCINFVTLMLGAIIAGMDFLIFFDMLDSPDISDRIVFFNEIFFSFVFLLFWIADCYELKSLNIAKTNKQRFAINQIRILKSALPLIDIVGFIGVAVILCISIHHHININDKFNELFIGFSIGSLVFHIILTQFNLAYLRYKYE
jgi:hypothetical protein